MTMLSVPENRPAPLRRNLARILAAMADAFETVFAVIDEATHQSAVARRRFPTAD